ncbi:peptide N-acetyl-beta-D-glucosaminyl asparaginase amidase A-domain-containing protein [Mycena filopes]|nr:peptide N-acetyl-beta-D-glucosaminyl asparaginase amidase A-domain-containing protein [Mycena filopes]
MKLSASCFLCTLFLAPSTAVLVDFQVAQPPPVPQGAKQCTIDILRRDFANSYGAPEIVQYIPPTDCGPPGEWAAVTLNLEVTSNGTQYDRLAVFTFQNVEIWRSSTPEPTATGIIWTYVKDATRYIPLFGKPGTFILELDNVVQPGLTGIYSTTVQATFYASSKQHPPAKKSNTIIPLSTLSNTTGNDASVPPSFSINVTLPKNAVEVYAELYASGNGQEEFWYFNAANKYLDNLPAGTTYGQGPFREVRLLVDGQIAGAALPYPVIFTGGIVPSMWRPITSYGALDLPTYFLDLTPFVPLLTDGKPHLFTIDVVSAEEDRAILPNWYISGLLQVTTDSSSKRTTGKITSYNAEPFAQTSVTGSVGDNGDVNITVTASRKIHITADILSGSGKANHVVFSQDLQYINQQSFLNDALVQNIYQMASGHVLSTHNNIPALADTFSYPLAINYTTLASDGSFWSALLDHSYNRILLPSPFILGSTIQARQITDGFFKVAATGNTGNGTSTNTFRYVDLAGDTYSRKVNAALNNITLDEESGTLVRPKTPVPAPSAPQNHSITVFSGVRLPGGRTRGT